MIPLRREYTGSPEVTACLADAVKALKEQQAKAKKVKQPKSK